MAIERRRACCEDFATFDSLEEKFAWDAKYLRGLAEVFD